MGVWDFQKPPTFQSISTQIRLKIQMPFSHLIPSDARWFGIAAVIQISLYLFEMLKRNPCLQSVG